MINSKKAVMIGCGFVGSASVFALMQSGLFTEIVLIDADKNKAEGEAMDISHGIPFASPMKIYAGDYDDVADAAIVVISAGAGQKPGETRLDLVNKNVAIFKSIIPEIAKRNFAGIMLVVANPVDILTQVAIKLSGLPENRVIGSGTVLDSARLRYKLGEHLSVDSRSVHAFIVGEHGDSEVVAWSSANVSGVPLSEMCEMRGHYKHKENTAEIATAVKNSAYEIINKKHATYYGIAMSVKRICEVIMREDCIKGWKFGPYVRESYVIHIVKKGKGVFTIGGKSYELEAGQAFIIRPGEETIYKADDDDPWSYMWVGFHGYRAEDFIESMGYKKDSPIIKIEQMDTCATCINNMLEYSQITRINEVKRQSALMMLFATIMEDNTSGQQENDNVEYPSKIYVKAAVDFITEKYMNKIKIDDIADFIGISRSHLTGSFKKEMGVSPQEYLINFRLEKAASLLRSSKEQINIIAYQCGYEDSLSFSKAFKQKFGMSPKSFRNLEVELETGKAKGDHEASKL